MSYFNLIRALNIVLLVLFQPLFFSLVFKRRIIERLHWRLRSSFRGLYGKPILGVEFYDIESREAIAGGHGIRKRIKLEMWREDDYDRFMF